MKIIFAGIMGRYPWGGVTWCSLMYLLGFRALGHEVIYIEDTCEANYDPEQEADASEPDYALRYVKESLAPHGLAGSWCYIDYRGIHHGMDARSLQRHCADADLFVVLSGGCWNWRDHYLRIPRRIFIDSDPAFTQTALEEARKAAGDEEDKRWYVDFFEQYTHLFTFGANIGTPACPIPVGGQRWMHTWQPVCTNLWNPRALSLPPRAVWTTLMTWQIGSFQDIGGNKDHEFLKVLNLANECREEGIETELAINGPLDFLRNNGWRCVGAMAVSRDPWSYHAFINSSRGEFSVAKHTYVASQCGWFSDRTICYLASGKPAVVQCTGFRGHLPTGSGLIPWTTGEEARQGLKMVEQDYPRHARRAREIALEHFDTRVVLPSLLDRIT